MMKYAPLLRAFVTQALTDNQQFKKYRFNDAGIQAKASFGQGLKARVPWIAFTQPGHTKTNGIYPVYLYFKSKQVIILAYGVSEPNRPPVNWNLETPETVEAYFKRTGYDKPERYGASYVYKVYSPNNLPPDKVLNEDLNAILKTYRETTGEAEPKSKKPLTALQKLAQQKQAQRAKENQSFDIHAFQKALKAANLVFSDQLVARYVASLFAKPFLILTGLSGSGKTQLAKSFARWICKDAEQYRIVPVGADWTNRDPLLGYPNGLKNDEYVLPETGVLQLLLHAIAHPQLPHFLILDEMNLSHVERYFADFLSAMESHSDILLHDLGIKDIPKNVKLPKNLFITGTVNIDETTYMFSPKVLDRANVIEFRIAKNDMQRFLQSPVQPKPVPNSGSTMGKNFLELAQREVAAQPDSSLTNVLDFFEQLQQADAEFGYRTAAEINRLLYYLGELDIIDGDEQLDIAIMQKLLPKLHGSRRKLIPILEKMAEGCIDSSKHAVIRDYLTSGQFDDAVLQPLTMGKLHRMYRAAIDNGFTSYAEA